MPFLLTKICLLDLLLECVTEISDLTAHESAKLAIFGRETKEGKIILLKRESNGVWTDVPG